MPKPKIIAKFCRTIEDIYVMSVHLQIWIIVYGANLERCKLNISLKLFSLGSGCGSVGRAVASDTRGPRFESSHQQKFIYKLAWVTRRCPG